MDSIDKLKARLGSLENDLRDPLKFKDFYHFTFNYAKNAGQKGLDLDMAIAYWNIVLDDKFKFLQLWCQFLQVSKFEILPLNLFLASYFKIINCILGTSQKINSKRHMELTIRLCTYDQFRYE